jgi:hypothetical protein
MTNEQQLTRVREEVRDALTNMANLIKLIQDSPGDSPAPEDLDVTLAEVNAARRVMWMVSL